MIKRILTALFCLCLFNPITSSAVALRITDTKGFARVLEKHFSGDKATQARVAQVYKDSKGKFEKSSTDNLLLDMCEAGGLVEIRDLSQDLIMQNMKKTSNTFQGYGGFVYGPEQETEAEVIRYATPKCKEFIEDVAWGATGLYYDLCGVENRKHIKGETACYRDFKKTNVTQAAAVTLASEYMRVRYGDDIVCKIKHRTVSNDDYVSCKSIKKRAYYEFQFDDVKESFDKDISDSIQSAVCEIHGVEYKTAGCSGGGSNVSSTMSCWAASCGGDSATCSKINKSLEKFGYTAKYEGGKCQIVFNEIRDAKDLKTACGINNFRFCAGDEIQINNNTGIQRHMIEYVANQCGIDVSKVWCTAAGKAYTGPGCNTGSWNSASDDDVISCFADDKQIDFVLDDINEWNDVKSEGGQQAVQCLAANGEFDGSRCTMVNEKACKDLQAINAETCPECKEIVWDAEKSICTLRSAESAEKLDKTLDVLATVGAITATVVVTVVSGGTALAVVGTVMVGVGGTTAMVAETVTEADIDSQIEELNRCNEPKCAEEYLEKTLQRLNGLKASMSVAQGHTADALVSKLIGLLPPDSAYLAKIIEGCVDPNGGDEVPEGCPLYEKNYTASQIVGWTGRALEFIGGVLLVVDGVMQWQKTAKSIADKVDDLKNTGWIREGNQWRNQSTGQVLDKLPREGVIAWDPNPNLRGGGRWRGRLYGGGTSGSFTKAAEVQQYIKMIDGVNRGLGMAEMAAGTYAAIDALSDKGYEGQYVLPSGNKPETPVIPIEPENPTAPIKPGGPGKPVLPDLDTDIEIEEDDFSDISDPDFNFGPDKLPEIQSPKSVKPSVEPKAKSNVQPYEVKDPRKTGLIATAAVLGAVGAGALIGGLVSNNKDDAKTTNAPSASKLEKDLETIMNNADKSLGIVNDSMIKLIPMATMNNTTAKIVNINGNAVAVVDYRGHNLPYYVNGTTGSWVPLLGIGKTGGWFNTYLSNTPPSVVEQVKKVLNQQLNPATVAQFVGANSLGVQFPGAALDAYSVINAEFPSGVVETFNGVFSPADQTLYNNNYQRMLNLFNTAAHLGGFFVDI